MGWCRGGEPEPPVGADLALQLDPEHLSALILRVNDPYDVPTGAAENAVHDRTSFELDVAVIARLAQTSPDRVREMIRRLDDGSESPFGLQR
jgi:hypothetical protein